MNIAQSSIISRESGASDMTEIEFMENQLRKCQINFCKSFEKDAVSEETNNLRRKCEYYEKAIEALRSADRKPRPWNVECKNRLKCPACGLGRNTDTQLGWNYCPECGEPLFIKEV